MGTCAHGILKRKNGTGKKAAVIKATQSDLVLAVLCLGFHSTANKKMTPGRYALEIGDFLFKIIFLKHWLSKKAHVWRIFQGCA
jgi:hypothetical protein